MYIRKIAFGIYDVEFIAPQRSFTKSHNKSSVPHSVLFTDKAKLIFSYLTYSLNALTIIVFIMKKLKVS